MSDTSTMADAHDHPHTATICGGTSGSGNDGVYNGGGMKAGQSSSDGGEEMDVVDDDVLDRVIGINDLLIELEHANHVVVLMAVAVLNEREDIDTVRTGAIRNQTNRIATREFQRHQVETSLKALYGEGGRFVGRSTAAVGNAYDWQVTEEGRELLGFLYDLGIIESLADSVDEGG